MPHLLFRGVAPDQIRSFSRALTSELAELCGCGTDNFILECLHTTAVSEQGELVPSFPFVEIAWFERGDETRGRMAEAVDRHIRALGYPEAELAFIAYREDSYYINGVPVAPNPQEELERLRAENGRLKDQLARSRQALLGGAAGGSMSSKLREALRE
ncbi:DUF1904 family protein [Cohnella faecalis]|uniref:DUF1904 family protein n=1 Tax=Cohnella faecalis TaxID=2315694 RepID=A0A398CU70_9BACL|nr:DUF1904 family protein [Cohnella faecalis]